MFRKKLRKYRLPYVVVRGRERYSQCDLTVLIVGRSIDVNYLLELAFAEPGEMLESGRVWVPGIKRLGRRFANIADMMFVSVDDRALATTIAKQDPALFLLPRFVAGEVDFATVRQRIQRSKDVRRDIKRIAKNGLSYRATRDPASMDLFVKTMYLPYIQDVYGDTAAITNPEIIRQKYGQSELLLITRDGEPLAGSMLVYEDGRARGWLTGVKNGDSEYKKLGVLAAMYYFEIEHLEKQGYTGVHYGGSRPFLSDGAIQYKRKWGMRLSGSVRDGLLLKALRDSPGARQFLRHHPFIHAGPDNTYLGAVFADSRDIQAGSFWQATLKKTAFEGLQQLVIHCFDEPGGDCDMPPECAGKIQVKRYSFPSKL